MKGSSAIDHWQSDREEIESEELLAFAMGVDAEDLDPEDEVPARAVRRFQAMVARRGRGEPVQFIEGYAEPFSW